MTRIESKFSSSLPGSKSLIAEADRLESGGFNLVMDIKAEALHPLRLQIDATSGANPLVALQPGKAKQQHRLNHEPGDTLAGRALKHVFLRARPGNQCGTF